MILGLALERDNRAGTGPALYILAVPELRLHSTNLLLLYCYIIRGRGVACIAVSSSSAGVELGKHDASRTPKF